MNWHIERIMENITYFYSLKSLEDPYSSLVNKESYSILDYLNSYKDLENFVLDVNHNSIHAQLGSYSKINI